MRKILLTMMAIIAGTTLSFADDSYELVTSASSLQAGDEVLIVYSSGSTILAMGAQPSGQSSNRVGVSVTENGGTITLASTNAAVSRFILGDSSGAWTFYSETNTKGFLGKNSVQQVLQEC